MTKNERLMMIGLLRINGLLATSISQITDKLESEESVSQFKKNTEQTMEQFKKITELMELEWINDEER